MGRPRKNLEKVPGVRIWKRGTEGAGAKYKITFREPGAEKSTTEAVSTDYEITLDKAKAVKARIDRIGNGLAQPKQERWLEQDQTAIASHIMDYEQALKDAGRDPKHIRQMAGCVRAVLLGTKTPAKTSKSRTRGDRTSVPPVHVPPPNWIRVSAVTVNGLRRQIGVIKEARSSATANRYLDATRAFFAWGIEDVRWEENPALRVTRFNAQADRRVIRRVISAADFLKLLENTEGKDSPRRASLTGKQRGLIYRVCVITGLRRNECRMLLTHYLKVDGARKGIALPAKLAKNRNGLFIPLPDWMAAELAETTKGKRPDDPALSVPSNTARMLRGDLEAVGIPYRTHDGVFDFHAIRHESGALLIAAGANPKAVQAHMRHSRMALTMDTYGHLMPDERDRTMHLLPDFGQFGAQRNAQRSSGNVLPSSAANCHDDKSEHEKTPDISRVSQWSDGESNPDLLNAIQPSDSSSISLNQSTRRYLADFEKPDYISRAARCAAPARLYRFRGLIRQRVPRPIFNRPAGSAARLLRKGAK